MAGIEKEPYVPEHASDDYVALDRIHLAAPDVGPVEREALLAAFETNWDPSHSSVVPDLEDALCAATGTASAITTTSGTAALQLGLLTLGVGPGDIVVIPSLIATASANVARYLGARLVVVDCEPETGNLDPNLLDIALRGLINGDQRPAAVIASDLYGSCADYSRIETICKHYRIPLLEDATGAIGASHNGRLAGSFGSLAAVSFATGGGALVGRRHPIGRARDLAENAREAVLHFDHDEAGHSYGLSNLLAAIASKQLERLGQVMGRTRAINTRYREVVTLIPGVSLIDIDHDGRGNSTFSVVEVDQALHPSPETICERMDADDIEARPTWKPMHLQPSSPSDRAIGGAAAEGHFTRAVCLPNGPGLSDADQERVISSFLSALATRPEPLAAAAVIDLDPEIDVRNERLLQHLDNRAATQRAA